MSVIYDPNKAPLKTGRKSRKQPKQPKPARQRRQVSLPQIPRLPWRSIGIGVLVLALLVAAGWGAQFWHSGAKSTNAVLSADKELVKPLHTYLTAADAKTNVPLNMSFVAPKAWRSTRVTTTPPALLATGNYLIGAFSFTAGTDSLDPNGQMIIENVTPWLAGDDGAKAASYAGYKTKAQKQAAINTLVSLRKSRSVDAATPDLMKVAGEAGDKGQLQYINSADHKLSGIIYLADVSVNGSKSQHVVGLMAGLVDNQMVLTRLDIPISDDPNRVFGQAGDLLRSLTLDTSSRNPQAPAVSK